MSQSEPKMKGTDLSQAFKVADLLLQYRRGRLDLEEQAELEAWAASSPRNRELMTSLSDDTVVQEWLDSYLSVTDADLAFETRIMPHLRPERRQAVTRIYRISGLAAAAAVLTLAAIVGIRYYTQKTYQNQPTVTSLTASVNPTPGGDRAWLTLSDGHRMALDNMANGPVSDQGGSRVVKTDNGLITYQRIPGMTTGFRKYNTLSTPRGGQFRVVLPDGSKVWLNAASSISYPTVFDEKERRVTLTGEAYFEVVHRPETPFIVRIQDKNTEVKVLGTHFNVAAYGETPVCATTVLEGAVRVSDPRSNGGVIKAGEQGQLTAGGAFRVVTGPEVRAAVAWKDGLFTFGDSLQETLEDIARWYDVDLVIQGSLAGIHPIGGSIERSRPLAEVLSVLETVAKLHCTLKDRRLIVTP